jgi:hypothetical protein
MLASHVRSSVQLYKLLKMSITCVVHKRYRHWDGVMDWEIKWGPCPCQIRIRKAFWDCTHSGIPSNCPRASSFPCFAVPRYLAASRSTRGRSPSIRSYMTISMEPPAILSLSPCRHTLPQAPLYHGILEAYLPLCSRCNGACESSVHRALCARHQYSIRHVYVIHSAILKPLTIIRQPLANHCIAQPWNRTTRYSWAL